MAEETQHPISVVIFQLAYHAQIGQDSIHLRESLRPRSFLADALHSTRNRPNVCDFTGNVANSKAIPSFRL